MKTHLFNISWLLCLLTIFLTYISCEKEPNVITKTITTIDTLIITKSDTIYVSSTDTITLTNFIQDTLTTFIVLRHAETKGTGRDPDLSNIGIARSKELLNTLNNISFSGIYSSNFKRTMQTAQPLAVHNALSISSYNPSDLNSLINNVFTNHFSKVVLDVGHSNTTPSLINQLIDSNKYSNIPENEYDNLYIVSVYEKGKANVLHLKYGK